ncbi:MAG: BatA domain-containing protein [Flavobacteriales bacterium]|nr:BatA domain-containing protein [Flavobacteriales bacterium]
MALWALALITVPIAIHLFQFRRYKKLFFSDVSLLKEVRTTSQTKNQLKHLLILLTRMLFVGMLVLAFAEPFLPSDSRLDEVDRVSIYVDNSFSMQASTGNGNLLQHATQAGYAISTSFPKGTRFQLITNSFDAKEKRFTDAEEFLTLLDDVMATPKHRNLSEVLSFQAQALYDKSAKVKTFLLSDFNHVLDSTYLHIDTNNDLSAMALSAGMPENISIDSAWLHTPITQKGAEQRLAFKVTNHGLNPIGQLAVTVFIEGEQIAMPILDLPPLESVDTSISFIPSQAGYLNGQIQVEDYPVSFDNDYYFTIYVTESIDVVEVTGAGIKGSTPFQHLFSSEAFRYTAFSQDEIKQDAIDQAQVLILNEIDVLSTGLAALANEKLLSGGNVLVITPLDMNEQLRSSFANAFAIEFSGLDTTSLGVSKVNEKHFLFNDVFDAPLDQVNLPSVQQHYRLNNAQRGESILTLYNGAPLLWNKRVASGDLFVITTPLQEGSTDFFKHALFVPAMINMAAHAGIGRPIAHDVNAQLIKTDVRVERAELQRLNDSTAFIPGLSHNGILLGDGLVRPGHYALRSGDSTLEIFSFNYSRSESQIALPSAEGIERYFADREIDIRIFDEMTDQLAIEVAEANVGTKLWPIFALLALLALVLETVLLKLFSK